VNAPVYSAALSHALGAQGRLLDRVREELPTRELKLFLSVAANLIAREDAAQWTPLPKRPEVVIVLPVEGKPVVRVHVENDDERLRLQSWIVSQPELYALLAKATELGDVQGLVP